MQAIERVVIDNSWITILLVCLFACVFLLRGLSVVRLKGSVSSLFNESFIDSEIEENTSFFNPFKNVIFIFSITVLALLTYKIYLYYNSSAEQGFYTFLKIFGVVFSYLTIKRLLEFLLSVVFKIDKKLDFFLVSKSVYLYSVSFFLLIAIVLVEYSQLDTPFLVYFSALLFSIRFIFHAVINKKLVFSELFYFILYLCAVEIAPLFVLFRLLF
ncbi:hypothetical protein BTO15_06440 [Polaribacter sejongensis]|uniref:DUF4271 domain-containing protein n=1 Tax=Polaribacter sejongensis TaxID=985043 RepID=A0AAJ1QU95_9FLAO|nr:DUF4271 domain-containing protein [Polaribacter undariae]AUC21767.1 hypothetical protein BTO15_06440 [Polaribacter sejongensis]MDN3618394.1 DUF4271 domain-containing protein [Polaribacter undariae]UWD30622.1 DUF4271 domain-containing protein [Polaribacter undariae]